MLKEFKAFIARGSVIDLAVGIIIGAAFTAIVNSLVTDVINPVIGMALGGLDFSTYYVDLSFHGYPDLDAAKKAGAPLIMYGLFINAVIKFLIVAFVLFLLVKQINRIKAAPAAKDVPPPEDIQLLREIRDGLKGKPAKAAAAAVKPMAVKSPVKKKKPARKTMAAKAKPVAVKSAKKKATKKKPARAAKAKPMAVKAPARKKAVTKKKPAAKPARAKTMAVKAPARKKTKRALKKK